MFPTYKLYRRQHLKLSTARHHVEFLTTLRTNHQAPKGLKPKVTTTTTELPPALYIRWEQAHIELANTLRDILLEHWQTTVTEVDNLLMRTYKDLESLCNPEELNTIQSLVTKATATKSTELQQRRTNKDRNTRRGATGGSATGNR